MGAACRGIAAALLLPLAAAADGDGTVADAISGGSASAAIRYRFEHVDQDGIGKDANASTARLRLNYGSGKWRGWSAFAEFDHVFHVIGREFNSGAGTSPGRTQYPVVADPSGSDLNQLYFDYSPGGDWSLRVGRQRILLDNQRFVGGVGWRQNEQTYDALTFRTGAIVNTDLSYTYVNHVRRIFGDGVPAGKEHIDGHLLNARVRIDEQWSAVPYLYYLDYDNAASAANSTATIGVRLEGGFPAGDGSMKLTAEAATQSDAGNNPVDFDADYYHAELSWSRPGSIGFGLGVESLGGGSVPGAAFRTPLATLHGFQGWADQFLATPDAGINDVYASLRYPYGDWTLGAIYHDFRPESGGGDFGSEVDLSAAWDIDERYGLLLKAALYAADDAPYTDTIKVWVQLTASYP